MGSRLGAALHRHVSVARSAPCIKPAVDSVTPDKVDPVSAATLQDTGKLSLGWLSLRGLLIVAGRVVFARRRTD